MLKKNIQNNKKNILILSDSYHPKLNSGAIMIEDLINYISSKYNIILLTFDHTIKKKYILSKFNNYIIIRLKTNSNRNHLTRFISEYSYSNKIIDFFSKHNFINIDYVINYSPSIFFGKSVNYLKKKYECNSYLIQRDLFPDWAYDQGLIKFKFIYNYLKKKEIVNYDSSTFIGVESKGAYKYINNLGYKNSEILNNWIMNSYLKSDITIKKKYNLKKKYKYFMYGGNLGIAQNLVKLISSLNFNHLKKNNIKIIICGSGSEINEILKIIKFSLGTVEYYGLLKRKEYNYVLNKCVGAIVSLSSKTSMNNYPLKFIDYIRCGVPVIAHLNKNNELSNFITKNNIGLCSHAEEFDLFNYNLNNFIDNYYYKIFQNNTKKIYLKYFSIHQSYKKIFDKL